MAFEPRVQRTPTYNFERPAQDQKKAKNPLMEEEIYIKVKPKTIVKTLSYLAIFLFIFYLGRWSIDAPHFDFTAKFTAQDSPVTGAVTTSDKTEVKKVAVETPKTIQVETKTASTNIVPTTGASVTEVPKTTTVPNTSTTSSTSVQSTEGTTNTQEAEYLTSYSKVAIALAAMKIDWKGDDWGKITQITYTIKNNEEGTIKADHFILTLENYDDAAMQKKIPIPLSAQVYNAGKSYSQTVNVPSGFTFAESTTGSLSNVRVGLSLYDAKNKMMGSASREYDLNNFK
jgi:hypothetical protein